MITIYNEKLITPEEFILHAQNAGFEYSLMIQQAVIKHHNQLLFWEECYFNIMANLRKMRFPIPIHFTPEYFEEQILTHSSTLQNAKVKCMFFPENNSLSFILKIQESTSELYHSEPFVMDVFKDIIIYPNYTSQLTNPKIENAIAQKYATENELNDVIFSNHDKNVARSILGNIYYILNEEVFSNSITNGAYKQAIDLFIEKINPVTRTEFSAFSLQKADEVFIVSEGLGIISVSQFRKKEYTNSFTKNLAEKLIQ